MQGTPAGEDVAAYPSVRHAPWTYPGRTLDGHFVLLDDRVVRLVGRLDEGLRLGAADGPRLDVVLAERGELPLAERTAILAYGANRCPGSLHQKMAQHGYVGPGPGLTLPCLEVVVPGVEVVWGGISEGGYVFADLLPGGPHVAAGVRLHVDLVDDDQRRVLHASEGVGAHGYALARLGPVPLAGGVLDQVLCYAGPAAPYLDAATGGPVGVAAVDATRRTIPSCDTGTMLQTIIDEHGLAPALEDALQLAPGTATARVVGGRINRGWWARRRSEVVDPGVLRAVQLLWQAFRAGCSPLSSAAAFAARGDLLAADTIDPDPFRVGRTFRRAGEGGPEP
jgi:hypothetical protein